MDPASLGRQEEITSAGSRSGFARQSAEDVAWLGVVPVVVLLLVATFWLAPPLSHLYPGPDQRVFPEWQFLIRPEPLEATRYLIAAIGPPLLAGVVLSVGTRRRARRSLDGAVIAIQVAGIGFIAWGVTHQPSYSLPFVVDYFDPLLLSVPILVAGVVIGALLTALLASPVEPRVPRLRAIVNWLSTKKAIALAVAIVFTVIWLLPAVVTDATVGHGARIVSGHIPAQAGDYFAVVNGRTPLVDYIPIYVHLLPLALAPVLAAFDLSLTSFSIAMCGLSLIALIAIYATFSEVTRRPWAALVLYVPFVALSLFPWDRQGSDWDYAGNYYAFFPGRYLGPCIVAWLCALNLRGRRMPAWGVFFAAGLAVANNVEFGVPVVVAAIVALAFGGERTILSRNRASRLTMHAVAGLGGALVLVCAITLARSGELPNPAFATYWSSTFARDGYGLVPMPTLGLHWALYFTYAAALLVAVVRYVRAEPDRTLTGMLAFAGVFGLVTGFYFAGRSVPWQLMLLFPVWGFALALLAWTAAGALRTARGDSLRLRRLMLPAFAALAGFGVMVASIGRFPPPWQQVDRLAAGGEAANDQPAVQEFVDSNTSPGEHVLIIGTRLDHRVAERAGVVNTSPYFGELALVSEQDVNRAIDFLEDDGGHKVFETVVPLEFLTHGAFPEVERILRHRGFQRVKSDPASGLVEWDLR